MLVTRKSWGFIFSLLLLFGACAADPDPEEVAQDCRYLPPEPVFNEQLPGLSDHRFERKGQTAVESFTLNQELSVRLTQSGCDYIRQVFELEWENGARGNSTRYWVRMASQQFRQLAQLGAPYLSFKAISDTLQQNETAIQLDTPFELQKGLTITISPMSKRSSQSMRIVLQQE